MKSQKSAASIGPINPKKVNIRMGRNNTEETIASKNYEVERLLYKPKRNHARAVSAACTLLDSGIYRNKSLELRYIRSLFDLRLNK